MPTETDERGVDGDLCACLAENPQSFAVDDIACVLGAVEGDDDRPWWWLLELRDGRPALVRGEYGRAGWRDRSRAQSAVASAPYADWYCGAACDRFSVAHPDQPIPLDVVNELARQEQQGRKSTRREIVGAALAGGRGREEGDDGE